MPEQVLLMSFLGIPEGFFCGMTRGDIQPGKTLMLQGTGSEVGKTFLTVGLCAVFAQDGYRVSPFKGKSIGETATIAGGYEMTKSQIVQAAAAGITPVPHMNPAIIKPKEDNTFPDIVLNGIVTQRAQHQFSQETQWQIAQEGLNALRSDYEIVVIEGLGSSAEPNLMRDDTVNMRIAKENHTPVLLVGSIENGGVFASLIGSMHILRRKDPEGAALVQGFIINKYHGEREHLAEAITDLERETEIPVVGVVPTLVQHRLPNWDTVGQERTFATEPVNATAVAKHVRKHIDMKKLYKVMSIERAN